MRSELIYGRMNDCHDVWIFESFLRLEDLPAICTSVAACCEQKRGRSPSTAELLRSFHVIFMPKQRNFSQLLIRRLGSTVLGSTSLYSKTISYQEMSLILPALFSFAKIHLLSLAIEEQHHSPHPP